MATTGAKPPTAASSTSETGWSGNAWLTPGNLYGAGDAAITASTFDAGIHSQVLRAYGFDFSAIPDGSTIQGVQIVIGNAQYATAICALSLAQLLDTAGARVGTNQYATPVNLTTSDANYTKGGATDLWGNALDAAWVKDPQFGVGIGVIVGGSNNCDVFIDSVTMEVWYTAPAPADTPITPPVCSVSIAGVASVNGRGIVTLPGEMLSTGIVSRQGFAVHPAPAVKI
jgi:hypothetical protein